ncbi:MAG: carboxy terminal-processing peptidase [Bacteriovoracaceae bacterium]|nr:carboxy terminal-processing peptidase [Bacteriovoracaceae bacterium]
MKVLVICFLLLTSSTVFSNVNPTLQRDQILGNLLKNSLELLHYSHKKLDDDLSQKSFNMFLERIDYRKQFLMQSDVDYLKKYQHLFDDELMSGDIKVTQDSLSILKKRIHEVEGFTQEILKNPINFGINEYLETDTKKVSYCKTPAELKNYWRKILKLSVLNKYLDEEKEQEQLLKKKPTTKKITPIALEKKARESVAKSYKSLFERMLKESHDDQVEKFINAVTNVFDPHTTYLPPQKKEDFDIDMRGSLEGIGALLREDNDYIKVVRVIPGSAAWKQKQLEPGDIILKVAQGDKKPLDIINMRISDAVNLIRGPRGSTVKLTIKKENGNILIVPIVRDVVEIEETYAKSIIVSDPEKPQDKYGYIYLPKFYRDFSAQKSRNCTTDVQEELKKLQAKNVKGVILDLRNNGGGALEDARTISGLFISEGPIVQVKKNDSTIDILKDYDSRIDYAGSLVVLTNRFSASASEILAAALQDYGRAIILGSEQTHGKGTVQAVLNLDNAIQSDQKIDPLGALKITIQQFYRISGGSTQYKGVTPDIALPDPYDFLDSRESDLEYSLPWDQVSPLPIKKWTQSKFSIPELITKSKERVKKNAQFKKMLARVNSLKKRKKDTLQTLNLKIMKQELDLVKKDDLTFKDNNDAKVLAFYTHDDQFVEFIKADQKTKDRSQSEDEDNLYDYVAKNDDFTWLNTLRTDPYLAEALHVIKDMPK